MVPYARRLHRFQSSVVWRAYVDLDLLVVFVSVWRYKLIRQPAATVTCGELLEVITTKRPGECLETGSMSEGEMPPILARKRCDAPSVFTPESLLREARRQKATAIEPVPDICLLDPDGDIVRQLKAQGRARRHDGWVCYHTDLYVFEMDSRMAGVVGCAVPRRAGGGRAVPLGTNIWPWLSSCCTIGECKVAYSFPCDSLPRTLRCRIASSVAADAGVGAASARTVVRAGADIRGQT